MSFTCILIGLFFLLNPNIVMIDILPDFIGYLLILIGITKASKLNLSLGDSFKSFRNLFILELCKLPATLLYISFASDPTEVWGVLFTCGFGFGEAWLGINAFRDLFTGLTDLTVGDDRQSVERSIIYKRMPEVKLLTYIFIIVKSVLTALPEFTTLSSDQYGTVTANGVQSLAGFRMVFTAVAFVIVLIFGIVWYARTFMFIRGLSKDEFFVSNFNARYEKEIKSNKLVMDRGRIFLSLSILSAAAVFMLEFKFDGFNYLPHAVFLTLTLIALIMLKRVYPKQAGHAITVCIVGVVVSVAVWIYTFAFISSFYGDFLTDSSEGASFAVSEVLSLKMRSDFGIIYGYIGMIVTAAIEAVALIALMLMIRSLLMEIIREHTGGTIAQDGHIIGGGSIEKNTKSTRHLLDGAIAVGIVSIITSTVQVALMPYMPEFWLIDFAIRIAYIALTIYLYSKMRYEMKDRYDLD